MRPEDLKLLAVYVGMCMVAAFFLLFGSGCCMACKYCPAVGDANKSLVNIRSGVAGFQRVVLEDWEARPPGCKPGEKVLGEPCTPENKRAALEAAAAAQVEALDLLVEATDGD